MNKNFKKVSLLFISSTLLLTGTAIKAQANSIPLSYYKEWGQKMAILGQNIRSDTESMNILMISAHIKEKYSSIPTYKGLNTDLAINEKYFPKQMLSFTKTPINSWKGEVFVDSSNKGESGKVGSSFTITYKAVPPVECSKMIYNLVDIFEIISVNDIIIKNAKNSFSIEKTSIICKKGQNEWNSNTIKFTSF